MSTVLPLGDANDVADHVLHTQIADVLLHVGAAP